MSFTIPDWHYLAACRHADPFLFFAPDVEHPDARKRRETTAHAICAGCPVRLACDAWARTHHVTAGIWGGVEREPPKGRPLCRNSMHVMDAANTYIDPDGHRNCRACRLAADQRSREREQGRAA